MSLCAWVCVCLCLCVRLSVPFLFAAGRRRRGRSTSERASDQSRGIEREFCEGKQTMLVACCWLTGAMEHPKPRVRGPEAKIRLGREASEKCAREWKVNVCVASLVRRLAHILFLLLLLLALLAIDSPRLGLQASANSRLQSLTLAYSSSSPGFSWQQTNWQLRLADWPASESASVCVSWCMRSVNCTTRLTEQAGASGKREMMVRGPALLWPATNGARRPQQQHWSAITHRTLKLVR